MKKLLLLVLVCTACGEHSFEKDSRDVEMAQLKETNAILQRRLEQSHKNSGYKNDLSSCLDGIYDDYSDTCAESEDTNRDGFTCALDMVSRCMLGEK